MSEWNDEHIFTRAEKMYILVCGLIVALGVAYITHLYFEYRVEHALWQTTFVSPKEFWAEVPKWEWKPIFEEFKG
jgi:hypothetical protein